MRADARTAAIDIVVEAGEGALALRGIVVNDDEKALAAAVVANLPGVKAVDNQLRTMTGGLYRFPSQVKDKG